MTDWPFRQLLVHQSLERGFCGFSPGGIKREGGTTLDIGVAGSAGVPSPDKGLMNPLGGTGMRISSGEPGIMSMWTFGILMRFASFWYEAGMIWQHVRVGWLNFRSLG
jgi:hypothetical protein